MIVLAQAREVAQIRGWVCEFKLVIMSGWKWDEAPPETVRHSGGEIAVSLNDLCFKRTEDALPPSGPARKPVWNGDDPISAGIGQTLQSKSKSKRHPAAS